jgi:hypothetical protein
MHPTTSWMYCLPILGHDPHEGDIVVWWSAHMLLVADCLHRI